jgi:hypothetical protein
MTVQYEQPDINLGRNFFFNEVQVGDPELQLTSQTQLATVDTANAPQTVRLPFARAAGPNATITIVSNNALVNPLTIATSAGDSFVSAAGFVNPIIADGVATTFKSNGADNWIVISQTA